MQPSSVPWAFTFSLVSEKSVKSPLSRAPLRRRWKNSTAASVKAEFSSCSEASRRIGAVKTLPNSEFIPLWPPINKDWSTAVQVHLQPGRSDLDGYQSFPSFDAPPKVIPEQPGRAGPGTQIRGENTQTLGSADSCSPVPVSLLQEDRMTCAATLSRKQGRRGKLEEIGRTEGADLVENVIQRRSLITEEQTTWKKVHVLRQIWLLSNFSLREHTQQVFVDMQHTSRPNTITEYPSDRERDDRRCFRTYFVG
ncbi:hypothetical protein SRHO_G00255050 [Serrasalmus rhombeus]